MTEKQTYSTLQEDDESTTKQVFMARTVEENEFLVKSPADRWRVGFWGKLSWGYLTPLMKIGYKRALEFEDFGGVRYEQNPNTIAEEFQVHLEAELAKKRSPWRALSKSPVCTTQSYLAGVLQLFGMMLGILPAVFLKQIIQAFDVDEPEMMGPIPVIWVMILGLFVCSYIQTLVSQHYNAIMLATALRGRTALNTSMYRKALKLSVSGRQATSVGAITNLMGEDVEQVTGLFHFIHFAWIVPVHLTTILILLSRYVGWAVCFSGLSMGGCMLFKQRMGKLSKRFVKNKLKISDERVKRINEMVQGIRTLKFCAWEEAYLEIIEAIRKRELREFKKVVVTQFLSMAANFLLPAIVAASTLSAYVAIYGTVLPPSTAFSTLALLGYIRQPSNFFMNLVNALIFAKTSWKRLQDYFMLNEVEDYVVRLPATEGKSVAIECRGGVFSWALGGEQQLSLDVTFKKGEFVVLMGPVGSGKSSAIDALLGELHSCSGNKIKIYGTVACCVQTPWIENSTLKENIIYGSPYCEERYHDVLHRCELEPDLSALPAGDMTEIGEKGVNLSGGQKARVAIARAAYANADIYIFDDVLAAVDAHVADELLKNVLAGPHALLKGKTIVMVSHSFAPLNFADRVLWFNRLKIEYDGEPSLLSKNVPNAQELSIPHTPSILKMPGGFKPDEPAKEGRGRRGGGGGRGRGRGRGGGGGGGGDGKLMDKEERAQGSVPFKTYWYYFSAAQPFWMLLVFLCYFGGQAFKVASDWYFAYWSTHTTVNTVQRGLMIYVGLCVTQLFVSLLACPFSLLANTTACKTLHTRMLNKVVFSPSSFFDTTPMGRVLNRFTNDVATVESRLFQNLEFTFRQVMTVASIICVDIWVHPWTGIGILPLVVLYLYLMRFYNRSVREVKRILSLVKSPIYSQLTQTLYGLSTIRAYGKQKQCSDAQDIYIARQFVAQNKQQEFMRWLGFRLDIIGCFLMVIVAAVPAIRLTGFHHKQDPGLVGLSMAYMLNLTQTLSFLVRQLSELENKMNSVERIKHYSALPSEAPRVTDNRPPDGWPSRGEIELKNLSAKYREGLPTILEGVSLKFNPGEKIGVVGRTGAGKSSLMLVLLRIIEPIVGPGGGLTIDGIDILSMGLKDLRSRLSIIPQDPMLFSGSIRLNLDPVRMFNDYDIEAVLKRVGLLDAVMQKAESGQNMLDVVVSEGGDNFSVGERQLICIARALLRNTRVLLLDEATASMDSATDQKIQSMLRDVLGSHTKTCIVVAHRLQTIMDSDKVVVLDKGHVAEFDSPKALLQKEGSIFLELARKAGLA